MAPGSARLQWLLAVIPPDSRAILMPRPKTPESEPSLSPPAQDIAPARLTAPLKEALPFLEIVRRVRPKVPDVEERLCPDRCVGSIAALDSLNGWVDVAATQPTPVPGRPCVILVLESPHKDEYAPIARYTPWPANGATGRLLRLRTHLLLPDGWDAERADLVLVNAVPYQCSLGGLPIEHRDAVFREAWRSGGREFFIQRLLQWYRPGDLVANACTKGGAKPYLREMVEDAIDDALPDALRRRHRHPCGWTTDALALQAWE